MARKLKKDVQEKIEEEDVASVDDAAPAEDELEAEHEDSNTVSELSDDSETLACGARLRSARIEQDLSTQVVAKQLRLSSKQIEALEQDDFATLPEPTIVKGFIRNYAKLLKIPADTILAAYAEMTPDAVPYAVGINPGINMKMTETKKPSGSRYWIFAVIFLLCLGAWVFYQNYIQKPDINHSVADLTETVPAFDLHMPTAGQEPALPEIPAQEELPVDAQKNEAETEQVGEAIAEGGVTEAVEAETAAVAEKAPPVGQDTTRLEFNATQETWLNVVNLKGKEVYNKILYEGNSEVIDVAQPLEVVVGNARGATLTVNGKAVDLAPYTRANVAHVPLNQ